MLVLWVNQLEHIKTDMVIRIGRIEINHVFQTVLWYSREHSLHELAVRVNHANTLAILDVLNNHIEHQNGFTGTGFSENINMLTSVFALDAKKLVSVPVGSEPKISDIFIYGYFRKVHIDKLYQK